MRGPAVNPLHLSRFTATTCLGRGLAANLAALRDERSGLAPCRFETVDVDTCVGEVAGVDDERLPPAVADFDCRNNRLAALGLAQDDFVPAVAAARARYGADRIGVFVGTSTSGILQTELAYRRRDPVTGALPDDFIYSTTQNSFSVADFVRRTLRLSGPAAAVSIGVLVEREGLRLRRADDRGRRDRCRGRRRRGLAVPHDVVRLQLASARIDAALPPVRPGSRRPVASEKRRPSS